MAEGSVQTALLASSTRLIINADDFGLTSGVNRGIIQAHQAGLVTSATLMANGTRCREAIDSARRTPELSIGCHIVLVDGSPAGRPAEVTSLMEPGEAHDRAFRPNLAAFAGAACLGRIASHHVEAEAVAQIRKLQAAGVTVSHIDTHKHTHVFPAVLKALLRAARICGVRAIRNPFLPHNSISLRRLREKPALLKRWVQVQFLQVAFARAFRRAVHDAGFITPDGSFGIIETGYLDEPLLRAIVEALPKGTWEFVCHPGYEDTELSGLQTRLRESRLQELQLLTSSTTRDLLAQHGIELISYHELVANAGT